jgi:amidase
MVDLAYSTAVQLVAALAARQVSSVELTQQAIARIEAMDGRTNAVVVRDFTQARLAADQADAALARGDKRPLLGIPMTIKESFNIAGLPTTWGMPQFKDWRPAEDAAAVARVRAAGAIILGKTNVPLGLGDWQAYNDVYGTTNNPWDLGRTPGGSSGGAAAALAAGYVPLEFGSDIGGSLRAPAHFCGVLAHNPSRDLVPVRGHVPPTVPSLPRASDLMVVGPMARSAADLDLLLEVVAGPDTPVATAYRLALPPPRHDSLRGFRVLIVDTHPLLPTGSAVAAAIERFSGWLARIAGKVAHSSALLPDLATNARIYMQLLCSAFAADLPGEKYQQLQDTAALLAPEDTSLLAMRARGNVLSHRDWILADRVREGHKQRWRALFQEWDVVVCPIMPTPAFPHDHTPAATRRIRIDGQDYPYEDQMVWAGVATLPGLPATAMPIGLSDTGLPIGVQVIGPFLEDRTTIAFAQCVEQAMGGFVVPPMGERQIQ